MNTPSDHSILIAEMVLAGWNSKGFRKGVENWIREHRPEDDYAHEILRCLSDHRIIPDLWRFVAGDSYDTLEIVEVECSHPVGTEKRNVYEDIWWTFDSSESLHMRLFTLSRNRVLARVPLPWAKMSDEVYEAMGIIDDRDVNAPEALG